MFPTLCSHTGPLYNKWKCKLSHVPLTVVQSIEPRVINSLYTGQDDDLGDLLPIIIVWKEIGFLLVENEDGEYVGLVTAQQLLNHYVTRLTEKTGLTVKDIMICDTPTVTEETLTTEAISLLRKHNMVCLPVVREENQLVGVVTERHFLNVADHFLREFTLGKKARKKGK